MRRLSPLYLSLCWVWITFLATGCVRSGIAPETRDPPVDPAWHRQGLVGTVQDSWLDAFESARMGELVDLALASNYALVAQARRTEQARSAVTIARSDWWPALSLSTSASRRDAGGEGASTRVDTYDVDLGLAWEIDILGRISAAQRQRVLELAAAEADLEDASRQLVANVVGAHFDAVEARQLLALFEQRLANLSQSLDIIESGYRSGINQALDVYLSQNSVEQERANVAQQTQALYRALAELELLLAKYPAGDLPVPDQLPVLDTPIPSGVPSELLLRRPDLQAAWLDLLALDASLAVAHKQRFPSLRVTASAGDSRNAFDDVLRGGSLAWSVAAGLSQPLFEAGRLRARESQARLRVEEAEQLYLDAVFRALGEVENGLSGRSSLLGQYQAFLKAEANAESALTIAFDQYRLGLIDYTTVLESQRRAFDAQTTVVRLKNQLLQNRIALYLSLGGDWH